MKTKVIKISKDTLNKIGEVTTCFDEDGSEKGLVINHYDAVTGFGEGSLSFTISISPNTVPYLKKEEFCIIIREKVDLAEPHVNEYTATYDGEDEGKYGFVSASPKIPLRENKGFIELKDRYS